MFTTTTATGSYQGMGIESLVGSVCGASKELLSFSQLGWRWGEKQNKWNKIGKGSASTANSRRRLGSNISIML